MSLLVFVFVQSLDGVKCFLSPNADDDTCRFKVSVPADETLMVVVFVEVHFIRVAFLAASPL